MKVRIVSQNPVFARNGRLFERADQSGNLIDHEVSAEEGKELLNLPDSIFREVDAEGNVIGSVVDTVVAEEQQAEVTARTFVVPGTESKTDAPDDIEVHVVQTDDPAPAQTTVTPVEVAPDADTVVPLDAKTEDTPAPAPVKKTTITVGKKADAAPQSDGTEGAVEV